MSSLARHIIFNAIGKSSCPLDSAIFFQCVRWRKPVYSKINASKLFYVRPKGEEPFFSKEEFEQKMAAYERSVNSLRQYFKDQVDASEKLTTSATAVEHEEEEWRQTLEDNKHWNGETAQMREKWMALDAQKKEELQLLQLMEQEKQKKEQVELARKVVLETLEQSKHFITQDNLVAEIERALDNPVSYNFAIDFEGNWHVSQPDGTSKVMGIAEKATVSYKKEAPYWPATAGSSSQTLNGLVTDSCLSEKLTSDLNKLEH